MPALPHRFLNERLAKAFSHRLRVQILQRLDEAGEASPKELAQALGEPVGNVSYHVRILRELDCVELVRTEPRRGAPTSIARRRGHGSTMSSGLGYRRAFAVQT